LNKVHIQYPKGQMLKGSIQLPGSKSISNRCLVIRALCGDSFDIENLSAAEDTKKMQQLLHTSEAMINAGDSGTVMRFLTAYYAAQDGTRIMNGSSRMQQRPIGPLVEALQKLGANIEYASRNGFPPLRIKGQKLQGNNLSIPGNVSSQFITALLLLSPTFSKDVFTLEINGPIVSKPYIDMTLGLMRNFGVAADWNGELIEVFAGAYSNTNLSNNKYFVEPDWSASAFWYQAALLADEAEIHLPGLKRESFQGDRIVADFFGMLGVKTEYHKDGITISKGKTTIKQCIADFSDVPDIVIPFVFACATAQIQLRANGLYTLRIKESDRIDALVKSLQGLGTENIHPEKDALSFGDTRSIVNTQLFNGWSDHRIIMGLAMTAIRKGEVSISDPSHVNKSYPGFWEDLKQLGFLVSFE
jgi:3-phosphoshikimate 1-carboxyvinyltransferase